MIGFLDELGNFKQKNYLSKCKHFLHFTATDRTLVIYIGISTIHSQILRASNDKYYTPVKSKFSSNPYLEVPAVATVPFLVDEVAMTVSSLMLLLFP